MTDQLVRDSIAIILTIFVCVAAFMNIKVPDNIITVWQIAIGFFFAGKISPTVNLSKAVPIVLMFLFFTGSVAQADVFNPIGGNVKYKSFLNSVNGSSINGNLLSDLTQIVNYLGIKEGEVYNFQLKKWVTTSSATIITYAPWNLSLDADLLDTDGVGGSITWNVGNYLPVQGVPVMQYIQYFSLIAGDGAENNSAGNVKNVSYVGAQFKLTFGS